jgi:hypothetical protein
MLDYLRGEDLNKSTSSGEAVVALRRAQSVGCSNQVGGNPIQTAESPPIGAA